MEKIKQIYSVILNWVKPTFKRIAHTAWNYLKAVCFSLGNYIKERKQILTDVFLVIAGYFSIMFFIGYFVFAIYYRDNFSYNTWVNDTYCTGKTVNEINEELKAKYEKKPIVIINPDETIEYIYPEEIDYEIDYTGILTKIKDQQKPYLWVRNMITPTRATGIKPLRRYNEEKLKDRLSNLDFAKSHTSSVKPEVFIEKTKNGYELKNSHVMIINEDKLLSAARNAFFNDTPIELSYDYLYTCKYTEVEKETILEYTRVKKYLTPKITLDMGKEQIVVGSSVLSEFITFADGKFLCDENGDLYIDNDKIREYVNTLCDTYNTADKPRKYITVSGEEKTIENVYYGTIIDRDAECEYLINAIHSGVKEVHTPQYIQKAYVRGLNDIGDTYIEVNLTTQKLYFFENKKLSLCCDIVSGLPGHSATPEMVCYVYKKAKGVILRGENYASYVDYWMPIYKAIGLHDASWQSKFGGDRYLTHGSHGCINLTKEDAAYIYDRINVGIPVIVYK